MPLVIVSPTRVEIDGADAGTVFGVYDTRPDLRPALKQALIDWHASHVIAEQQREAAKADAIKAAQQTIADKDAEHAEALAEKDEQITQLGGVELAEQRAREAKRAAALEAKAKAEAELQELDGPLEPTTDVVAKGKP